MKKMLNLCLMALCMLGTINAQMQLDTIYYDKDWKGVDHPAFATYYRITMTSGDPNIQKRYRGFWMDGTLQGEGCFIYMDKYDDSKTIFDGEILIYYKSGNLKEKWVNSENGTIQHSIKYREDGTISVSGGTKNGKLDGKFIEYHENGKPFFIADYKEGKYDGNVMYYDINGDIKSKTAYTMGVKNGEEWRYTKTGTALRTYENDVLNGPYKWWKNGKLYFTGTYVNGCLDGPFMYYDANEKPNYIIVYKNGLKISEQGAQSTINYTELSPNAGNNDLRISAALFTRTVGKNLVKVNDVTLNILNPTNEEKAIIISNIKVNYIVSKKEDKQIFPYNQIISATDAVWLYDAILNNVNSGVEAIASRIAKEGSTSKVTSTSQSNSSVYHSYYQFTPDAVGRSSGSTTTTYQDKALEYQLREKEGGTANAIKMQWKDDTDKIKSSLICNDIALKTNEWTSRHILSFAEIHHKLASQVKGDIEQIIVSFDVNGVPYSIQYDCKISKLTPKIIEDRDDLMDDMEEDVRKYKANWSNVDYYVEYGAWYNYKSLIESHTKSLLELIKAAK